MGLSHSDFTIAWITTSRKDFTAAQQVLDDASHDAELELPKEDLNTYFYGRVGTHNILVMCLERRPYGTISASKAADGMLSSFPLIRVVLIVGTASGVPTLEDVRLGDVVIGEQVVEFDGPYSNDDNPQPNEPRSQPLLNAVQAISVKYDEELNLHQMVQGAFTKTQKIKDSYQQPQHCPDRLYRSEYAHRSSCDCLAAEPDQNILMTRSQRRGYESIKVHFGKIALSKEEVENAGQRDAIANILHAICLIPADHLVHELPCLQIRGIRDYSDTHKSDAWHGYAAAAAAVYTARLVEQITSEQILRAHTAVESTAVQSFFDFVTGEVTHAVSLLPQSEEEPKLKAASRAFRSVQAGLNLLCKLFEEVLNDIQRSKSSAADNRLRADVQAGMKCILNGQDHVKQSLVNLGNHAGKRGGAKSSREERVKWQELQKNAQGSMAYLQELSSLINQTYRKAFGNGGVKKGHDRGNSTLAFFGFLRSPRPSPRDSISGPGDQERDYPNAGETNLQSPTEQVDSGNETTKELPPPQTPPYKQPDPVQEAEHRHPPTATEENIVVASPTNEQLGRSIGKPDSPPKPPYLQSPRKSASPSTTSTPHSPDIPDGQNERNAGHSPPLTSNPAVSLTMGLSPSLRECTRLIEETQHNHLPPAPGRPPPDPPRTPTQSIGDDGGRSEPEGGAVNDLAEIRRMVDDILRKQILLGDETPPSESPQ
ncbi:uncharacterized protein N7459_004096 [Penicillium hispanicum]|uniref:uncharacterized protein n=1 Tax=Penicillium hispanicum TaxID=1080232 RepID=UPI002541188F|nr:uncharacterized protein N7459_004096 [Penicillium hispanicum]KAJ5584296.1 hypothetical protein N7459_004096 [Penicillium hispanicum]